MGGNITDFRNYYQPSTLMGEWEIRRLPPEMKPTEIVEKEDWENARKFLDTQIAANPQPLSPTEISQIYSILKSKTRLKDSDLMSIMNEKGFINIQGMWLDLRKMSATEALKKAGVTTEKVWYKPWTWFK
jgi:hypothetical protein